MIKNHLLFIFTLLMSAIQAQTYDIYVSDAANFNNGPYYIFKFNQNGENPEIFIEENLAWPQDILFLEDQGIVLISNLSSGLINRHDADTGAYIDVFASGIGGPTRMAIGADGYIYVLQWTGGGPVLRYMQDGTFVDEYTSVGVNQAIGIDWDASGNLYVSSYGGGHVRKFDTEGIDEGLFINTNLAGPTNIWFEDNGDLLVVDYNGGSVDRFDSEGNFLGAFMSGLGAAEGVAFPDSETILIGNGNTHAVKHYTAAGVFVEDIIPNGSGGLLTPNAVVLRSATVGLTEVETETGFLISNLGYQFEIRADILQRVERIEVRDIKGSLVYQGRIFSSMAWQADDVESGTYFMTFFSGADSLSTQKIQVVL
jgi:hypothetical protein